MSDAFKTKLASAPRALPEGHQAAAARLNADMVSLLRTTDGAEGITSFVERRPAKFTGRHSAPPPLP